MRSIGPATSDDVALTPLQTLVGLTERHIGWRVDGIRSLGLDGQRVWQAASPLPAFEQLTRFAAAALRDAPRGPLLVVDHGVGGYAVAIGVQARVHPLLLLGTNAARHARALFPRTSVIIGSATSMPVCHRVLGGLVVGGIGDDLPAILRGARRTLAAGGRLCIAGIVSASDHPVSVGRLAVRPLEWVREVLDEQDLVDATWAVAHADVGDWMAIEGELAREISRRRRADSRYDDWVDHRRLVDRLVANGELLVAAVTVLNRASRSCIVD